MLDPIRKPVYLDYLATTPVDPRVLRVMLPYFSEDFGNASSRFHSWGWKAEAAVEHARARVAELVGATPREIVFTSGATEADNLAILGVAGAYKARGNHIVTSCVEHKAVLDTCRFLETKGYRVTYLPVDRFAMINLVDLENAICDQTILVSIMAVNNEVGTISPLKEVGSICKRRGVIFHTDAAQAAGKIELRVDDLAVDLLSLSGHKIYGPKGVGALYIRRKKPRVELEPQIHGGGHERGLRSGTLNVPGIVGLGEAARLANLTMNEDAQRIQELQNTFWRQIESVGGVKMNGHPERRVSTALNFSVEGVDGESLMMALKELAFSTGSACLSASLEPSYVLREMGLTAEQISSSLRLSLGRPTTVEEVKYAAKRFVEEIRNLRAIAGVSAPDSLPLVHVEGPRL